MKKKILIIGNGANAYALAKKLSEQHEIFIAPSSDTLKEFATCLDIREDNITELLEFVLENGIDMTIPFSAASMNSDIVSVFTSNRQQIFSPSLNNAKLVFNKAQTKKLFYKLRIPTPKFGIFEKQNVVNDYLKNQKIPFVLKTNASNSAVIQTSILTAKNILDSIYIDKNNKVIIEDYIYGTPFTFYSVTDGYKALPIGSSIIYRHSLEGDGGQLTSGMGAVCPNYKISYEQENFIMNDVIYPIMQYLESGDSPYMGILGVNGIITDEGSIIILGLNSFFQDCDAQTVLSLIDDDLYNIFEACIIGSFSDEYEIIKTSDNSSVSIVLTCKNKDVKSNVISGLDKLDDSISVSYFPNVSKNKYLEYEAPSGQVLVLSSIASSAAKSRDILYSNVNLVKYSGMHYRRDICECKL